MGSILQDLRFGIRTMAKDRAFTLVAIVTLALALGANTAIFSVVNGILLKPLPFPRPDRLVKPQGVYSEGGVGATMSYPNLADLRTQSKSFTGVGIYVSAASFVREGAEPEPVNGAIINADLLPVLGVKPALGRAFTADDDKPGAAPTIILGHDLWKRAFGSDTHIIGRSIQFGTGGKNRTVIGVMPEGFHFPLGPVMREYWLPLHAEFPPDQLTGRGAVWLQSVARLPDGVSLVQARADVDRLGRALERQYPQYDPGFTFRLSPLHDYVVQRIRPAVLLLMGAVLTVLLIGCANVANLLLARAAARRREIAIRSAVGATRGRIVAQLLAESVLLAIVAGAFGLVLATWGVDVLKAFAPSDIPRIDAVAVDRSVLLFTLGLSVLTGVIFGIAPALHASKADLNETLKEGTRGSTEGKSRQRVRNTLVTAAIALSLVLLAGAGLLIRSFLLLTAIDAGFDYENTTFAQVSARQDKYSDGDKQSMFASSVLEAMRRIPGVTSAGATDAVPMGPDESGYSFQIVGDPPAAPGHEPETITAAITPGYFTTLSIPIRRGRDFRETDNGTSPPVVVVSEAFVRKFFPGRNPLGQRVILRLGEKRRPSREIVGVVGDVRSRGLNEDPPEIVYMPFKQEPWRYLNYIVRSNAPAAIGPALREAIHEVDREQPIRSVRRIAELRGESLSTRRFNLILLVGLSVLALLLAAVGIYSLMSYTVTQRTSEIGIRMALGAETSDVFRLIVGNAVRLVAVGIAVGVAAALVATRVMRSLLFGVGANDPITFAGICLVIASVALIASWLPARRASRVDPLVAIRYD